ncbi:unnamed protein product [Rhizoctonia solani]|uniref:Uncharacterized protein n=1 Tax=Rhizoctonia solani TaxID=456999 RepID=A0A8H3DDF4_9AGAM|nr:unnamed protein product [Rhizoctonia solani]
MGRLRRSRVHKAQRDVHRASRTRARTRDLDLIQLHDLDPAVRAKLEAQPIDVEKPGRCVAVALEGKCALILFILVAPLTVEQVHKRRCKQLKEPAYTIEEAERAGGIGREVRKRPNTDSDMQPAPETVTTS